MDNITSSTSEPQWCSAPTGSCAIANAATHFSLQLRTMRRVKRESHRTRDKSGNSRNGECRLLGERIGIFRRADREEHRQDRGGLCSRLPFLLLLVLEVCFALHFFSPLCHERLCQSCSRSWSPWVCRMSRVCTWQLLPWCFPAYSPNSQPESLESKPTAPKASTTKTLNPKTQRYSRRTKA